MDAQLPQGEWPEASLALAVASSSSAPRVTRASMQGEASAFRKQNSRGDVCGGAGQHYNPNNLGASTRNKSAACVHSTALVLCEI